eukprot:GHVH01007111.1.p1 GENE.GHVH01007111.1~~GHVH01007111.1.p1  ORF type:complete len:579 (-),score=74.64 GHVH01007111.1:261-1997(-)
MVKSSNDIIASTKLPRDRVWSKLHERYQSVDVLGQGTYGVVYKAQILDESQTDASATKEYVALKRTALDSCLTHGIPDTALREMAILNDLNHPNIVDTIEFSCNLSRVYLVMELIDKDLKGYIRAMNKEMVQQMPMIKVKHIVFKVLQGISYLHSHRITHRDLKPHNILVSNDLESIKLADFGLARPDHCPTKTLTHEVVTLWYRPPEILLGECVYGSEIDIWSLGCILGELLLGKPLFAGESELDTLMKIFSCLGTVPLHAWPHNAMQLRHQFPEFPLTEKFEFPADRFDCESDRALAENILLRMLALDPNGRICASECINHSWFDSIRDDLPYKTMYKYQMPKMTNDTKAEDEENVLPLDTCLSAQLEYSRLQHIRVSKAHVAADPTRKVAAHSSSFDDEQHSRQALVDHLLLSIGGLNAHEILERPKSILSTAIIEHDLDIVAPETPIVSTLSSYHECDKREDRIDEARNRALDLGTHNQNKRSSSSLNYVNKPSLESNMRASLTPAPFASQRLPDVNHASRNPLGEATNLISKRSMASQLSKVGSSGTAQGSGNSKLPLFCNNDASSSNVGLTG